MRPRVLCSAVLLVLSTPVLAAPQSADASAPETPRAKTTAELDRIVVTATRTQRAVSDVPNSVDVIDRDDMDRTLTRDLRDLFRYEPGISVNSGFGRFGLGDIRIRGLEGNRVRIQTDGIAVPDTFLIGSFSDANRNFVDMDTLKRVEVVRGPTSSLYGSDALGGTVSFVTKDPQDYLKDGAHSAFNLRLGNETSWDGLFAGATAAFGNDRWSGMVSVSHRQGQETKNKGRVGGDGAARTKPNPQDRDGRSVLAKLVFAPSERQRWKLTAEGNEDHAQTELLTSRGYQPATNVTNLDVTGNDHQRRTRVSLSQEMDALASPLADSFDWQVYTQYSQTWQQTREVRLLASGTHEQRDRRFDFDQRVVGVQANLHKQLGGSRVRHDISYGVDVSRTQTTQERNGLATNLDTGATSSTILPDVFPVRDFPLSRTTTAALYLQDEMSFADDAFRLVPAVRVDRYSLRPRMDAIFAEDNPGVAIADIDKTSVSPKLGAVWHFAPAWSLYGDYARGFRSPPYADVNIGFTNFMFGYTAIANPDLKPETSTGVELGLRYAGKTAYASLSAYDNRYHDFIESFAFVGFNDQGLMVFQSRNVSDARIRGVEFKGGIELGAGWRVHGAAAWARGDNRTDDVPLDSIDPLTATLGVAYDAQTWGAELAGRFAGRRDRLPPTGDAATRYFASPGYGVFDLMAHWNFAPGAKVDIGVFNLANRKYFYAGDMALVDAGDQTIDRYTAPGRNVSASFSFNW